MKSIEQIHAERQAEEAARQTFAAIEPVRVLLCKDCRRLNACSRGSVCGKTKQVRDPLARACPDVEVRT